MKGDSKNIDAIPLQSGQGMAAFGGYNSMFT